MNNIRTRRRRTLWAAGSAAVLAALAGTVAFEAQAGQSTWAPTAAERQTALKTAHLEADSSIPGSPGHRPAGLPAQGWPRNVTKVQLVGSTHKNAAQFVGGDTGADDRRVLVVRMRGNFELVNTGPAGADPISRGHQLTIVLDASTGQVLDVGLEPNISQDLPGDDVELSR